MSRSRFRLAAAAAIVAVLCGVTAPSAGAHALLVGSTPLDSEVLATSPKLVVLEFAEPIEPGFSGASLADDHGRPVPGIDARLGANGSSLVMDVPTRLPRGAYSVSWHVLSDDGHSVDGVLVFGVGSGVVVGPGSQAAPLRPGEAVVKWLLFAALAAGLGGFAAALVVFPQTGHRRRALRAALWGTYAALLLGCLQLATQVESVGRGLEGTSWSELLSRVLGETRWGTAWLIRQALLALLAAITLLLLRRLPRRAPRFVVALSVLAWVAVSFTLAVAGHSAGLARDSELAVTVDALHLLSACLWIGVVAITGLVLLRSPPALRRASFRPVARVAVPAAVLVVATGLYSAGREIVTLDALSETLYGNALLAKSAAVVGMGLFGAVNATLVRPDLAGPLARLLNRPPGWTPVPRDRLGSLVAAEAALGAAVLLAAGILASAPPGASDLAAGRARPAPTMRAKTSGDLFVSLAVKPNRPGENVFLVRTASTRRPAGAPVRVVSLSFQEPGGSKGFRVRMKRSGLDSFQLGGRYLDRSGRWRITAVVERKGLAPSLIRYEWSVGALAPLGPGAERGALERGLTLVAVLLLAGLVAVCGWVVLGRPSVRVRASAHPEPPPLEELPQR